MKKVFFIAIAALLAVACKPNAASEETANEITLWHMEEVASFPLSETSTLCLYEGNGTAMVAILYGDEVQDFVGTGNTMIVRDSNDAILLDTVQMAGVESFIVRTADRSSTYGAEACYIVYPCFREMAPEGPWSLFQIPFDVLSIEDMDGDGESEIVHMVRDTNQAFQPADSYLFADGLLLPRR